MWMSGTSTTSRRKSEQERRERKDRERDREKDSPRPDKEKKKLRRKPSATKEQRDRDRDRSPPREKERDKRPTSSHSSDKSKSRMSIVPEMERRPSGALSAATSTYPSFSKKYSKEAVGAREDVVNPRLSLYTPDPTDLGSEHKGKVTPERRHPSAGVSAVPPSPPLTTTEPDLGRSRSGSGMKKTPSHIRIVSPPRKVSLERGIYEKADPRRTGSTSTLRRRADSEGSSRSSRQGKSRSRNMSRDELSVVETATQSDITSSSYDGAHDAGAQSTAAKSEATSTATSTATESTVEPLPSSKRTYPPPPVAVSETQSSPLSAPDSSPRTPTPHDSQFPASARLNKPRAIDVSAGLPSPYSVQSGSVSVQSTNLDFPSPTALPPPPPPPPVTSNIEIPRVDYLLQNGGLPNLVPKRFTSVLAPSAPQTAQYPTFVSPRAFGPQHTDVRNIFSPLQGVLDSYLQVLNKNGSIAVATGYRSVARRLLDRLEAVFNRNISSETCECIMCTDSNQSTVSEDEDTGLSWGEILEYVSGRRELPAWPPFSIATEAPFIAGDAAAPMQKLDIDVPEEYREHYIRQSKRTKDAVQNWLTLQPEMPSSPPQEVDDETLMFAMITHLEPENRKLFTALLRGMSTLPASRAPTPAAQGNKSELVKRTSLALQRLYRLQTPPRDAECAIFLLRNQNLHSVLATLAAISSGEWDILVSGRFDGFLWSGADGIESRGPSRGPTPASRMTPGLPSRGPTPFMTPSRGPTASPAPSSFGAPVQMDEDTEIAVLAEVEREVFAGMDALEDAFEALHAKAEEVRAAILNRNAGLNLAASRRRGSWMQGPEAVMGTPGIGVGAGMWGVGGPDEDDWNDDSKSEIRPDDSASNISYNRRRRRHRDKERRQTPAPVEEEDESIVEEIDEAEEKEYARQK